MGRGARLAAFVLDVDDDVAAQMLYLPLDGDTRDHSGTGRHGQVASGQRTPSFTCLDKSVNCSALFTAGQCITVPSLAMTPFTSTEVHAGALAQVPKASFVVHFKRVPSGPPTKQGLHLRYVGCRMSDEDFVKIQVSYESDSEKDCMMHFNKCSCHCIMLKTNKIYSDLHSFYRASAY